MGHNMLTEKTIDSAAMGTGSADVFGVDLGTISVWDDDGASAQDGKTSDGAKQATKHVTGDSAFSPLRQERRCSDESSSGDFPFQSPGSDSPFFTPGTPSSGRDSSRKLIVALGPGPLSPASQTRRASIGSATGLQKFGGTSDHEDQIVNGFLTPTSIKTTKVLSSQDRLYSSHGPTSSAWDATEDPFAVLSPASSDNYAFPVEWKSDPLDEFVQLRSPSNRRRTLSNELKAAIAQPNPPFRESGRAIPMRPRSRRASMGSMGDGHTLPLGRISRPTTVMRNKTDSQVESKLPRPNRAHHQNDLNQYRAHRASSDNGRKQGRLISADEWGSAVSTLNDLFSSSSQRRAGTDQAKESSRVAGGSRRRSPPRSPKQSGGSTKRRGPSPLPTTSRKSTSHPSPSRRRSPSPLPTKTFTSVSQPSPSRRRSSSRNRPTKDGATGSSGLPLSPTLGNTSETNKDEKDKKSPRRPSLAGRKIKYEKNSKDDNEHEGSSATSGRKSMRSRTSKGSKGSKSSRRPSIGRTRDATATSDVTSSPKKRDPSPSLPPHTPRSERTTRRSVNVVMTDSTRPPMLLSPSGKSPSKKKLMSPSPRRKIKYVKGDGITNSAHGKDTIASPKLGLDDSQLDLSPAAKRSKARRRASCF